MKDRELRKMLEELDLIFDTDNPSYGDWRKERFKVIDDQLFRIYCRFNLLMAHLGLVIVEQPKETIKKIKP